MFWMWWNPWFFSPKSKSLHPEQSKEKRRKDVERLLTRALASESTAQTELDFATRIAANFDIEWLSDPLRKVVETKFHFRSPVEALLGRELSHEESALLKRLCDVFDRASNEAVLETVLGSFLSTSRMVLARDLGDFIGLNDCDDESAWRRRKEPEAVCKTIELAIGRSLREDESARIAVLCRLLPRPRFRGGGEDFFDELGVS